jgi:hypothetical protein
MRLYPILDAGSDIEVARTNARKKDIKAVEKPKLAQAVRNPAKPRFRLVQPGAGAIASI